MPRTAVKIKWDVKTLKARKMAVEILTKYPVTLLSLLDDSAEFGDLSDILVVSIGRVPVRLDPGDAENLIGAFLAAKMEEARVVLDSLLSLKGKVIEPFCEVVMGGGPLHCSSDGKIVQFQEVDDPFFQFYLEEMKYTCHPNRHSLHKIASFGSLNVANHLLWLADRVAMMMSYISRIEQDKEREKSGTW